MSKILVGNIQRFSLHDGPGIRTTVFLMGCSIHCPWCANPENLYMKPCCYPEAGSLYGQYYSSSELVNEILKDEMFFVDGGGVTFSGGEALLQTEALLEVWRELKNRNIHIAIETALFVPHEYIRQASEYIDLWMIDVKILEPKLCRTILGGDVNIYRENFSWLMQKCENYILRFPLVCSVTMEQTNLELVLEFLQRYSVAQLEIFSIHDLAREKYTNLGMEFGTYHGPSDDDIKRLKGKFEAIGIACKILNIS